MTWKKEKLKPLGWFRSAGVNKKIDTNQKEVKLINYMDVYKNHQISSKIDFQKVTAKDAEIENANVITGDVLFTPSSEKPTDIGHAGVVMEELDDTVYSYHLVRFRPYNPETLNPLFFSYLLNTYQTEKHFVTRATGTTRYTLSLSDFKSLEIEYPETPKEQTAIATILSKVDEAIEATRQSIKQAEKLKKALMQNLLTGKLKPDGTWRNDDEFYEDEKFGKYPKDWNFSRFKNNSVLQRGKDLTDKEVVKGKYPVVKSNGVQIHHNQYFVEPPGVVTGRSGTIGKVFYIEEKFWSHNTSLYVKDFKGNNPRYIYYLIYRMDFRKYYAGTTVPTLNRNDIHRLKIAIPKTFEEQERIATKIDGFDKLLQSKQTKIRTLQRLKKSLMQNLLTGKIRLDVEAINKIISEQ